MLEQTSFPFASLIVPVDATSPRELTVGPVSSTTAYGDHHINRRSWIWLLVLVLAALVGVYCWWYTQKEAAKKLIIESSQDQTRITPLVQK